MESEDTNVETTKTNHPEELQESAWNTVDWLNESTEGREVQA
jgi:hypothetical protein